MTRIARLTGSITRWSAFTLIALLTLTSGVSASPPTVAITRLEVQDYPKVRAYVSVVDEQGESLSGLTRDSFALSEEGQEIADFSLGSAIQGREKIAVALVVDRSGSMKGAPLDAALRAAREFADRMSAQDALTVTTFSSRVDPSAALSTDRASALASLPRIRAGGKTALYDAICAAAASLEGCQADRKAVVALTDGQDNASKATPQECVEAAGSAGADIYCVGLGRTVDRGVLEMLSSETGGEALFAATPAELTGLYRRIAAQIRSQYLLRYTTPSSDAPGAWHGVEVTVAEDGSTTAASRDYIVPSTQPSVPATSGDVWLWAVPAMVGADALLVIALLRRRRRVVRGARA